MKNRDRIMNDGDFRREQIRKTERQFFYMATVVVGFIIISASWMLITFTLVAMSLTSMMCNQSLNPLRAFPECWDLYKRGFLQVRENFR